MLLAHVPLVWFLLTLSAAGPDEGQWLPQQFLEKDWAQLQARGLALSKDEFWHPERGGVLSAAVNINGCTASLCSKDGLVVTNHHCGFDAINRLSSLEKNYLEQGFVAADRSAELPAPGMVVFVLKRIDDVTAKVHEAQAKARSDVERQAITDQFTRKIVADAEAAEPHTSCSVSSFLDGQTYHLIYRTRLTDVRLVYAPPRSVGEYGGEDDNWMWPRHTGDFSFFRAYVGPDGLPAAHSDKNVPYEPKHWLKVSGDGVKAGDLVMILGYPGRTNRYLTSVSVAARHREFYPRLHRILRKNIELLENLGKDDAERALSLQSAIKRLSNQEKNARGMLFGLTRNRTVEAKLHQERAFQDWVDAEPNRRKLWTGVLPAAREFDQDETAYQARDLLLVQMLRQPLVGGLVNAVTAARDADRPEGERVSRYGDRAIRAALASLRSPRLLEDLDTLELPMMGLLLTEAQGLPQTQRLSIVDEMSADLNGMELADLLYKESPLRGDELREALAKDTERLLSSDEPLVRLARGLAGDLEVARIRNRALEGRRLLVGSRWIESQQAFRGSTFYPDANGTLRVSVATVKGYEPRDGVYHTPHTTLKGLLAKETGTDPFKSPEALKDAARANAPSRFRDKALSDVPVCFLSDADTTGGNSGSPVINGKGELVGLNFDRVFENVAGDFGWNPERSRNISVDIRFVLWNLEHVLEAPNLLAELGF